MREACSLVWLALVGLFRSRASLEAEILILRHQLNIQRRQSPKRLNFSTLDQIVLALEIEALRRPADGAAGNTRADPRDEYRQSTLGSATNSWRASQARHRDRIDQCGQVYGQAEGPPSQGWKTFLRNHADGIAAMDLFVVPTISFRLLYGLLIMGHGRRQILWFEVTAHPTAEWIANQVTEACGWEQVPRYL